MQQALVPVGHARLLAMIDGKAVPPVRHDPHRDISHAEGIACQPCVGSKMVFNRAPDWLHVAPVPLELLEVAIPRFPEAPLRGKGHNGAAHSPGLQKNGRLASGAIVTGIQRTLP